MIGSSHLTTLRRPAPLEPRPRLGLPLAALTAVVALPTVVATVRAVSRGWLAVGDNGNFLIRSRDVLTAHHPLLGTWSSASIPIGEQVNHPGPLLFDLFAVPAKLGGSAGLAVGVMLLHVITVALIGVFAARTGGLRVAAAALMTAAALSWTMGSELLYDPWQPHTLLLPVLLVVVLVVGMVRGDRLAMPVAAAAASLVVQTHLSYTLLLPPLCGLGIVCLLWRHRRGVVPHGLATVVVLTLGWAQPLVDQINGEGNLATLAGSVGTEQETVGGALGVRIVAEVMVTLPWWARDGFGDAITVPSGQSALIGRRPNIVGLPSVRTALAGLVVLALGLAAAGERARRRSDHDARAAVIVAGAAIAVALAVTVRLPVGGVGVPPHQVRYLWPVAVFATGALLMAVIPQRLATRIFAGAAMLLAGLALPTHAVPAGPQADADAIPIVRALSRDLGSLDDEGTVLYDTSEIRFAEPWTSGLMAAMQERGIDFTVDDPVWARQLGSGRADRGDADVRVFVREGDAALVIPTRMRRVAFVRGLTMAEQRELAALERSLVDVAIELDDDGRAARSSGSLVSFSEGEPTARQLLAHGELAALLRDDLLVVPDDRADDLARYADLRTRWDRHTVALFLDPTPYT